MCTLVATASLRQTAFSLPARGATKGHWPPVLGRTAAGDGAGATGSGCECSDAASTVSSLAGGSRFEREWSGSSAGEGMADAYPGPELLEQQERRRAAAEEASVFLLDEEQGAEAAKAPADREASATLAELSLADLFYIET